MWIHASGSTAQVWTPAKLNLFLEVLGKRPDGYHEIETLMVPVSLCDWLHFSSSSSEAVANEAGHAAASERASDERATHVSGIELVAQWAQSDWGADRDAPAKNGSN